MEMPLPANLIALHVAEDQIFQQSRLHVEGDPNLIQCAELAHECMDHIIHLVREHQHQSEDELTVQQLGLRMFNTAATAFKLCMSGYYQVATTIVRDLLEVTNLLDLFLTEPKRISQWRNADAKKLRDVFGPAAVRKALEQHPDKQGQRRDHIYRLLSTHAAHATHAGFRMMSPGPDALTKIGPFFDASMLKAVLEELMMRLAHGTINFTSHFIDVPDSVLAGKAELISRLRAWWPERS